MAHDRFLPLAVRPHSNNYEFSSRAEVALLPPFRI
jgi:hypothetical protein